MTVEPTSYVAYLIAPAHMRASQMIFSQQNVAIQQQRVNDYVHQLNGTLVKTFIEMGDLQRQRHRWPELVKAVNYCLEHKANLIIGEIKNLTRNEAFVLQILRLIGLKRSHHDISVKEFKGSFHCCDQPFINPENFLAIAEHAKEQKKLHGQLIKAGLSRTSAKSGNPHALDVICQVNKPKIENAIVFALLLQPIISEYRAQGYSQRKMVTLLNEEGFHAPEGGEWVLSQLQKILDRINLNECAINLEKQFLEYRARHLSDKAIADQLNKLDVPAPKENLWTAETVSRVSERIKQIHDILRFNEFVMELMPILEKYHIDELTEQNFINELVQAGIITE